MSPGAEYGSPWPGPMTWDGILGHQVNKSLESFAPCYSQSLLLADFKENHSLLWFLKILTSEKQAISSLFMNSILNNGKMRVENQTKKSSLRRLEFTPRNLD
jgi:hypothetical protein